VNLPEIDQFKVCWRWQDGSIDLLDIKSGPEGWALSGRHDDTAYWMMWNKDFTCRWLRVVIRGNSPRKSLHLTRTAQGWQHQNGALITGSQNALFPDLGWTAITNTLPIRHMLDSGEDQATHDVLLVAAQDLAPKIVRQSYRRTTDGWHYHNHDSDFSTVLAVDKRGIVTDYPGVCTRIEDP